VTETLVPLRVVIAEDSVLIREGIARLIEESARPSSWQTAPAGPPGSLDRYAALRSRETALVILETRPA
jgi:hypothetical protein